MNDFQPVAGRITHSSLDFEGHRIPLVIASGMSQGPTLVVIGLQHATEFSGPAAMDLMLTMLNPADLSGTLVFLPFVSPLVVRQDAEAHRQSWINPETNLNRQWPGEAGSANKNSRLAAFIWKHVLVHASAILDFHCCRTVDPRFCACLEGHKSGMDLAEAMQLDAIDLQSARSYAAGVLIFESARILDVPSVLIESHPSGFQVREAVNACTNALGRAMVHMKMLSAWKPVVKPEGASPVFRRSQAGHALKAAREGYLGIRRWAGDAVTTGETVAVVRSLETFEVIEDLRSPVTGAVGSSGVSDADALVKPDDVAATVKEVTWVAPGGGR